MSDAVLTTPHRPYTVRFAALVAAVVIIAILAVWAATGSTTTRSNSGPVRASGAVPLICHVGLPC